MRVKKGVITERGEEVRETPRIDKNKNHVSSSSFLYSSPLPISFGGTFGNKRFGRSMFFDADLIDHEYTLNELKINLAREKQMRQDYRRYHD